MPVYRGIKITIISQYGAQILPEYAPARIFGHHVLAPLPEDSPALLDSTQNTATVYVPIFPRSQFWFQYQVYVPRATFLYFKLFANDAHLVSWGTGDYENYIGKAMFGLFDGGNGGLPERRLFAFSNDGSLDSHASTPPGDESLEIRVYRADSRVAQEQKHLPFVDEYSAKSKGKNSKQFRDSLQFNTGGEVTPEHPVTRYQYALVDSLDAPYATFRWLPRTWHELDLLDVVSLDFEPSIRSRFRDQSSFVETIEEEPQYGPAPYRVDESSPIRVPVYGTTDRTMEVERSPAKGTVAQRLSWLENQGGKRATEHRSRIPGPRRHQVLEPRNDFDRIVSAQPAHRANLLESVVSQLFITDQLHRTSHSGSPHSQKALGDYLRRRLSARTATGPEEGSPTRQASVMRLRAQSHQAQIEVDNNDLVSEENHPSTPPVRPPTPFALINPSSATMAETHPALSALSALSGSVHDAFGLTAENTTPFPDYDDGIGQIASRSFSLDSFSITSYDEPSTVETSPELTPAQTGSELKRPKTPTPGLSLFELRGGSASDTQHNANDEGSQRSEVGRAEPRPRRRIRAKESFNRLFNRFNRSESAPQGTKM